MNNKIEPTILPGFMELLPEDQIAFNRILRIIKQTYELFGFSPIDTPVIEKTDILLAKAEGETEKQIYRFKKGDNDLALRFDLTVPLARYVAQKYNDLTFPFKRYQIGKAWRGEKSQKGRYREFYQCDFDIIDNKELDLTNDAEIIAIIYSVFKKLNFGDFVIKINNKKILNNFLKNLELSNKSTEILRIIDKLSKIGEQKVEKELQKLEIEQDKIGKIFEFIKKSKLDENLDGAEDLKQVLNLIKKMGVSDNNIKIDFSIVRGQDYYTGIVYETFLKDYTEIGCICGGGRYDNLAECYTDKKFPGVGASIGLTRLFSQLKIKNKKSTPAKVLVVSLIDDLTFPLEVANKLRLAKIKAQTYFDNSVKIKKKFTYANKLGIPFVVVIGDEEVKTNKITLKNMKTGKQNLISIDEAVKMIKSKNT
ncbi:histidine--tRNA ligase [Patescibacteria group bacterium]